MAINKNAYIRYQVLDRCFRNTGRNYTIENLLEEVNNVLFDLDPTNSGIKRRQLFEDIKYMESEAGFSIDLLKIRSGKTKFYRYEDPEFSIRNEPLNPAEAEYIKSAVSVLSRLSGAPQFNWVNELVPMLETKFGASSNEEQVISFDTNDDYEGLKNLQPLFNAIINKRVLKIVYKGFTQRSESEFIFHPYYLKQYNNRWFVFGFHDEKKIATWNLALDRIISLTEIQKEQIPNITDWEDYFYDIIGVSRAFDKKPEEITLFFNNEAKPYILTKPLHPTQKWKEVENGVEVRIKVIPNFELMKLILSHGNQVTVLKPDTLVRELKEIFKSTESNYL